MKMNKYLYYIFTAISFALLIAAPGRFAFGIIVCFELFFLLFVSFIFSFFTKKLHVEELNSIFTVIGLVFSTILYKQIIMWLFPLVALQMSFVFYLPAVSSYVIGIIYNNINQSTKVSFIENIKIVSTFTIFVLLFYAIRDVFGYGTFTLPTASGLIENVIFETDSFSCATILASIPGALVLVSISILIFIFVQNKFKIIKRAGDSDDSK